MNVLANASGCNFSSSLTLRVGISEPDAEGKARFGRAGLERALIGYSSKTSRYYRGILKKNPPYLGKIAAPRPRPLTWEISTG